MPKSHPWMLALATFAFAAGAGAATVETDKVDYAPEETVYVIGSGWQPGETVALTFGEDPHMCDDRVFLATADGNGDFLNSDLVLEWHDFHVTFTLVATGLTSSLRAETVFTDGLLADAISVSGDSISRAFDANTSLCNYGDNVTRVWATGDSHGTNYCGAGSEGTFSHAERLECAKGTDITNFNDAASGANMRADFFNQASAIRTHLSGAPGPRYVPVFMGHNDICTNTTTKTGNTCSGDQDPNNYCRTTTTAFEREFRRGMDQLIQIPSVRIIVEALARVSMLCTLGSKSSCGVGLGLPCSTFWSSGLFNVCKSLTIDCSSTRKIDAYNQAVAYNNILRNVTAEYAAIPTGGTSATGAVKASDVAIRFGEGVFNYKFQTADLSCCDCFHPSDTGQQKLAQFTYSGLQCSSTTPCCAPSTDALTNANCSLNDTTTFYPGGYWAGNPCGNGIVDPGEQCDLGADNGTPTACCTGSCQFVTAGTTCRTAAGECDQAETCSGSSATCPADVKKSAGTGCTPDANDCTSDVCNGTGDTCTHPNKAAGASCGSSAATDCTDPDTCDGSGSCQANDHAAGSGCTDDGNDCTTDVCNATGSCTHPNKASGATCGDPSSSDCDDADTCNGSGTCQANHHATGSGCTDDGNDCTTDVCNATGTCTHPNKASGATCGDPSSSDCDDADTCNGSGACQANHHAAGSACTADGNVCTDDVCNGSGSCTHPNNTAPCNDGNACTQTDVCSGGSCVGKNYSWSGVLQPINDDGSSIFKLGSTIPVKFKLTNACAGNAGLVAHIVIAKISNSIEGNYLEATSTSAADTGNTFRYDPTSDQYIYNLATNPLSAGTWQIAIDLGDGSGNRLAPLISLKK